MFIVFYYFPILLLLLFLFFSLLLCPSSFLQIKRPLPRDKVWWTSICFEIQDPPSSGWPTSGGACYPWLQAYLHSFSSLKACDQGQILASCETQLIELPTHQVAQPLAEGEEIISSDNKARLKKKILEVLSVTKILKSSITLTWSRT